MSSPAKDALEQSLDPAMTEWERGREQEEFVRASILYRPSKSSLSSRFTRGKHEEDEDNVEVNRDQEVWSHQEVTGFWSTITSSYISHNAPGRCLRLGITDTFSCFHVKRLNRGVYTWEQWIPGLCFCCQGDVDDKQSAVNMKMFGKMTRETFEWHPDKLLCKRFNVPEPYPG